MSSRRSKRMGPTRVGATDNTLGATLSQSAADHAVVATDTDPTVELPGVTFQANGDADNTLSSPMRTFANDAVGTSDTNPAEEHPDIEMLRTVIVPEIGLHPLVEYLCDLNRLCLVNLDPLLTTPLSRAFRGRHVVQVIHQLDPVLAIDFLADKGLLQNYADALVGHAHSGAPVESSSTAPLTGAELSALTRESGGLNSAYHERRDKNGAPDSGGSARTDRSDGRAGTTTPPCSDNEDDHGAASPSDWISGGNNKKNKDYKNGSSKNSDKRALVATRTPYLMGNPGIT